MVSTEGRVDYTLFMDFDRQDSTRKEWDDFSGNVQSDVNEILTQLDIEIEKANLDLESMTDEGEIRQYVREIIAFLDKEWGEYRGDSFLVSGNWLEPTVAMDYEKIISRLEPAEAFRVARSNGFMAYPLDGSSPCRIGLSFIVASAEIQSPSIQGGFDLLAFGYPDQLSLQFLRPKGGEVVSTESSELSSAINRADSLLRLYLNDPRSNFYKLSAKRQQIFLNDMLQSIEGVMPSPESMDKLMIREGKASVVYFKESAEGGILTVTPKENEHFMISGHVVGVTIVGTPHGNFDSKKYLGPHEIHASESGISFVVEPGSAPYQVAGYEDRDQIVSVRSLKDVELALE